MNKLNVFFLNISAGETETIIFIMELIVDKFYYKWVALGGFIIALSVFHFQYFLYINLITLALYYIDKEWSTRDTERIPENFLLLLGLFGGWMGAILAQQTFRHKSIKQPFQTLFICSIVVNILAMAYWKYAYYNP